MTKKWSHPVDVNGLSIAFGGDMSKLLPAMSDIPKEFKEGRTKWNDLVGTWFYRGLKNTQFKPKDGIDKNKALRHVKAIMGSWEPKHEHKEAGCAYLLSEFFEDVTYEPAK
ncbi:hypothetical protein [Bacillus sp. 3255]|uniref:hypothetical protein n=1 Tax=Bacillus sp. 3255 TaxID=2817904 RepID=UPI0028587687|nr:hypothetical protein [Bacillus sp. 3255]MDR6884875.1 maltooligosyltrehalose synthase [Bacillus sp. 3255]